MEFLHLHKKWLNFALLSLIFLQTLSSCEAAEVVQCYVCSWQQPSKDFNITDTCTHYNFSPINAKIVNCTTGGCEAITYRHPKHKDTVRFHRNCLNTKTGVEPRDKCYTTTESNRKGEPTGELMNICECTSTLCNSGPSFQPGRHQIYILAAFAAITLSLFKNLEA